MIDKIQSFKSWTQTIITSIIGVLSGLVLKNVSSFNDINILLLLITIFIIILISKFTQYILNKIIANSVKLRKLLLGKHFIEGYWIEGVIDISEVNKLESFAIIKISYIDTYYEVSGDSYSTNGKLRGSFQSIYSDYEKYHLRYSYKGINSEHNEADVIGNAEIKFSPSNKYPVRLTGNLIDNFHKERVMITAEKLDEIVVEKIDMARGKDRVKLIKDYLEGIDI